MNYKYGKYRLEAKMREFGDELQKREKELKKDNKNIITHRKDALIFLSIMGLILTALFAFVAIGKAQTVKDTFQPQTTQEGAFLEPADPCGLDSVVCPNEPKIIYAEVTKYTAVETCSKGACINARGFSPIAGQSVACPRSIDFGKRVSIGGSTYTCDDRLAARYDHRFDIFAGYSERDYQEALAFGVQVLPVVIK